MLTCMITWYGCIACQIWSRLLRRSATEMWSDMVTGCLQRNSLNLEVF
jgi:hypothetical protein